MTDGVLELAALAHAWSLWARAKQLPPATGWKSWGFVAARGFGKTKSCAELTVAEIMAGRARRIGFASFNLEEGQKTLMHGQSGLVACSPPWFAPEEIKGELVWPNGATARPFTPEVPDGPRGPEHDWFWCSELAAWPPSSRDEFFKNIREGLRIGLGRMVFDTTPRARNPLVRYLLQRAERDPAHHVVVRGATQENRENLTGGFVEELLADYGDSQRARQELHGEFFDDADGALFQDKWIERARRDLPTAWKRRILSVDPAISVRKGTDETGIVELGLGVDDQVYVVEDLTDRLAWEVWGALVIDRYVRSSCDCVIVERNRGGDAVVANLRACAQRRGFRVEVLQPDALTRSAAGTIYVKETISRKSKALRAEPVASLYERGRVSHVRGADLAELEETMCTWLPEGGGESPNALDAMVHGVFELADLARATQPDGKAAIAGAAAMQAALQSAPASVPANIATLFAGAGTGRGDRI